MWCREPEPEPEPELELESGDGRILRSCSLPAPWSCTALSRNEEAAGSPVGSSTCSSSSSRKSSSKGQAMEDPPQEWPRGREGCLLRLLLPFLPGLRFVRVLGCVPRGLFELRLLLRPGAVGRMPGAVKPGVTASPGPSMDRLSDGLG